MGGGVMIATKNDVMQALYPLFRDDERYVLLVGDMGFSVLDQYFDNHKDRVFNAGIAEQAMVGMAAGMCLAGLRPIVYSQIPFLTMRAFEQIRYDICEHHLDVLLVGIGADNYFEKLGRSHCIDNDDVKILSIFDQLQIIEPSLETCAKEVDEIAKTEGPRYIRCK
jgi:transketolase